ncbi:glycosyltransferase family 4 protein [Methylocystis sp.]|uniref:glycosyltransferase family 4 protein n=1 Tax=Methylocystis sp. TaxID=1911079 RepID=UPI003DA5ECDB
MARILVVAGLPSSLINFRGPLIEALVSRGHEVHAAGPPADEATLAWLAARGVDYHPAALENTGFSVMGDIRTILALRRIMLAVRPDLMFAYTIKPVIYGTLAAASAGVKRRFALISGLGYAFTDGDRSLKRGIAHAIAAVLYALTLRLVTGVFFQNPDDAALFQEKKLVPARLTPVVVNGSGIDIDQFRVSPIPKNAHFLMISRLVADKGVREFVDAARLVKNAHPEATFDLVGPRDANPAAISPTLIPDAVRDGVIAYHGEARNVRPFIDAASIYVLPSYREGTPRTVLEAMATGRAIITTDAPGCRETVIDGYNGFIVPVRDVPALARVMTRFIENPTIQEEMGGFSRKLCEEKYDVRKVTAVMLDQMEDGL